MSIKNLFFFLLFVAASSTFAQQLYLNEFLSNGLSGTSDWLEIYNPNNQDADISGWNIWDSSTLTNHYILPASTVVPANGFLVLLCDDTNTGLHTNFKLSSGGETVWFANVSNVLVDTVAFPALTVGTSYGRNPDGSSTFEVFITPTQGSTNGIIGNLPPVIGNPTQFPVYPMFNESVTITASVIDDSGLTPEVTLYYDAGDGYQSIVMQPILSTTNYMAVIPAQSGGKTVKYYIKAEDNLNAISLNPSGAPATFYSYLVYYSPQKVFINEIMASNTSAIQDPDFSENVDYIELFNSTDALVDISGWYITDNLSNTTKWQFPNNSVIASKGFLIIWADNKDTTITALHTNFALSKSGESVGLYNSDLVMVDTVTFVSLNDNSVYCRNSDGDPEWIVCGDATPGAPNPWVSVEEIDSPVNSFTLHQNYPNPFNPSTKIRFSLPSNEKSTLNAVVKVYDILGNLVTTLVNEKLDAGTYEVTFNASNLSSGIYFYTLQYGVYTQTCKMSLIK
ncbi:MAG: lamin tail domain-containing protein [bacterium]